VAATTNTEKRDDVFFAPHSFQYCIVSSTGVEVSWFHFGQAVEAVS
jgi:hypothetical protein